MPVQPVLINLPGSLVRIRTVEKSDLASEFSSLQDFSQIFLGAGGSGKDERPFLAALGFGLSEPLLQRSQQDLALGIFPDGLSQVSEFRKRTDFLFHGCHILRSQGRCLTGFRLSSPFPWFSSAHSSFNSS